MKIGIMTAMDQEYEMVSKVLKNHGKHEIIPVHCGWGKVNSAVNAYKLISEHHPDCILFSAMGHPFQQFAEMMSRSSVTSGCSLVWRRTDFRLPS